MMIRKYYGLLCMVYICHVCTQEILMLCRENKNSALRHNRSNGPTITADS